MWDVVFLSGPDTPVPPQAFLSPFQVSFGTLAVLMMDIKQFVAEAVTPIVRAYTCPSYLSFFFCFYVFIFLLFLILF